MKPFGSTVVAIGLVLLTGCSSPDPGEAPKPAVEKPTPPAGGPVVLATTTSTQDSGLLDELIAVFEKRSGIVVKTVAVGTGHALELGRRGEADVLLVHAPEAEQKFIEEGHGTNRRAVMHNDFVIVGPESDPAGLKGQTEVLTALQKVAETKATWISRGDRSGTHQKALALWSAAAVAPNVDWYIESGQGMGATLRIASERRAYTLADRGTFLAAKNLNLVIHVEGDPELFNQYSVIQVTHDKANRASGRKLADFFCDPDTQQMIGAFTAGGFKLFVPDAKK